MSADFDPWPGGNGCPLERFRARALVFGRGAILLASFAFAFHVVLGWC